MVESIQTIGSRVKAYLKDGHETGVMTLATYPDLLLARPGAVPWKPEDRVIRRAASIATQLVGGRAELFCWGISQSMPGDGLGEIKRILADPKLSDNEKYYLLKTKASAAAAAFLDNYDPSEWFIVEDDTSRGLILPSSPEPGTAVAVDATPPVVPGAVSAAGWMPCWGAYHVSNQDAMKGAFDLIKDELEKHGFTFSGLYNGNNIDYFDDLLDREDGYWFLATHGHGDGVLVETCGSYQGAIAEFQNSENSGENSGEFREFRGHNKRFLTPGGVLVG
jgi:hypothetical protein